MKLTLEENFVAVITEARVIDDNLNRQIKNFLYLYITPNNLIFYYISNWSKVVNSFYPPSFFNIHN